MKSLHLTLFAQALSLQPAPAPNSYSASASMLVDGRFGLGNLPVINEPLGTQCFVYRL